VREPWVVQDRADHGLVAADHDSGGYAARQDPRGVLGDRADQLVGLVAPSAGEALLGPAAGGGPGLDVPGAHLGLGERAHVGQPHGIPTATDQDHGER
jgi:hypothetical protein